MEKITTVRSDREWAKRLDRKLADAIAEDPRWDILSAILLGHSFGGVAAGYEEDIEALIEEGEFYSPEGAILHLGLPNQCHSNSAALVDMDPTLTLVTGWAQSEDECWRQHSWVVGENGVVIETTSPRTAYYGIALSGDALTDFMFFNF